ncbi:threonylcarbamoyl-AMP synthase [Candidatus Falkowbacteria bacterium CG1_02_37_21]|nr:MAG: threonylcarbamoyl-AMP synthase [Candidatus Falkowbacteria bacterium CG1_02_37_21]
MEYHSLKSPTAVKAVVKLAVKTLLSDGIVVLPTDTVYGLSARVTSQKAIKRIQALKKRTVKKPFLILVSSLSMLKKYVFLSRPQLALIKKYWQSGQRPTTIILRHRGLLPASLNANSDGLALRLPKSQFLIKIIKTIKEPLISTSLNISGEEPIKNLKDVARFWPDKDRQPDLIIDAGLNLGDKPSQLIDLRIPGSVIVLRK